MTARLQGSQDSLFLLSWMLYAGSRSIPALFLYRFVNLNSQETFSMKKSLVTLLLAATLFSVPVFANALEEVAPGSETVVASNHAALPMLLQRRQRRRYRRRYYRRSRVRVSRRRASRRRYAYGRRYRASRRVYRRSRRYGMRRASRSNRRYRVVRRYRRRR